MLTFIRTFLDRNMRKKVEENKKYNCTLPSDLISEVIKHLSEDQIGTMRLVCHEARNRIDSNLECGVIELGLRNHDIYEININNTVSNIRLDVKLKEVSNTEIKDLFNLCDSNTNISIYVSKRNVCMLFKQITSLNILLKKKNIKFKYLWCYILEEDGKAALVSHISIF